MTDPILPAKSPFVEMCRSGQHLNRAYFRRPHRRGYHIIECCVGCGVNVRGPGRWVSKSEIAALGIDPNSLPLAPQKKENDPRDATLFDNLEKLS